MAITKKEVSKVWPQKSKIGANLVIEVDDVEVMNVTVWTKFKPSAGPTLQDERQIQTKLQRKIDAYKAKKAIYDKPAYAAALGRIQTALEI